MPISRNLFPIKGNDNGLVILSGRFVGNGASDPTTIYFKGVDAVDRFAAGTYLLTLPGTGSLNVLTLMCEPNLTSFGGWAVASVDEATRIVTIKVYQDVAGVATLTDLTSNDSMSLFVVVKNSRTRS